MKTIWKYDLVAIDGPQGLAMPLGAEIVGVDAQRPDRPEVVQMWAVVDPEMPKVDRQFVIVGTGHPWPVDKATHRGLAVVAGGALVWHVLELDVEVVSPW